MKSMKDKYEKLKVKGIIFSSVAAASPKIEDDEVTKVTRMMV